MSIKSALNTIRLITTASSDEVSSAVRNAAIKNLARPPLIFSAPTAMKLWSLKEQQEFYQKNPMFSAKIPVKHLSSEYVDELIISADCLCDLCQTKYPEWNMHSVGDLTVCDGCFDHYN